MDRYFLAPESLDDSPPGSPSGSSHHDSTSKLSSGSSHQGWPPMSPAASFHEGPGSYQYHPYSWPPDWWVYDPQNSASYHSSEHASPSGPSHQDFTSEPPSSPPHMIGCLSPSLSLHTRIPRQSRRLTRRTRILSPRCPHCRTRTGLPRRRPRRPTRVWCRINVIHMCGHWTGGYHRIQRHPTIPRQSHCPAPHQTMNPRLSRRPGH